MSTLHHFFVHFPVALLLVSAASDLAGVIFKREFFTQVAIFLLVLSALGGIAAAVSGNAAEAGLLEQELLATQVPAEMKAHTNWGNTMIWVILLVAVGRIFAKLEKKSWAEQGWLFPVINVLLAIAVVYTGWLGGRLTDGIFDYLQSLM